MAGALGDGGRLPVDTQAEKGQSLGLVADPSLNSGQSKELDPAVVEKLKREIALKAEATRKKSLLSGKEISSPQGGSNQNEPVRSSKEDFAPENLEAAKPGTQNAVMESLRQKTLFSEDSPEPKVEAGEQIPVDPYNWLKSIQECDQAFDLFRARYVPFGPYSELTLERKQDVDGAIQILCGTRFSRCEFDLCGIPKKGEDTRDSEIIRAEYVELVAARNQARADIVKAARKESKGKKSTWRRFSLEVVTTNSGNVEEGKKNQDSEMTPAERRYRESMQRRKEYKGRFSR